MAEPFRLTKPGAYDLTDEQYHGDPAPSPSLSSSIAKLLVYETPRHAWMAHPRLNPRYEPEERGIYDRGTAAHACLVGRQDTLKVIPGFADWRKDAAKAARDKARAEGLTPVLEHEFEECTAMALAIRAQLNRHAEASTAFINGMPEVTLLWSEGEGEDRIWCRARLDWLFGSIAKPIGNMFFDFKSTGAGAGPNDWGKRTLFDTGAHIQHAFYRRGIRAVLGISNPVFQFVVAENTAPYAISVMDLAPETIEMADEQVEYAIDYWRWCTKNKAWPGFPRHVMYVNAPPWHMNDHADRQLHRKIAIEDGEHLLQRAIEWQAPL